MRLSVMLAAGLVLWGCEKERTAPPVQESPDPVAAAAPDKAASKPTAIELLKVADAARREVASFLDWAAVVRAAPEKITGDRECYPAGDMEAGWCDLSSSDMKRNMRYRQTQPKAFTANLLGVRASLHFGCGELGGQAVREWLWQGVGTLSHCRFADGPLKGLQGWIKNSVNGQVYVNVFSPQYLKLDPEFADTLKNQGTTL